MFFQYTLIRIFVYLLVERPARRLTYADLAANLERSGQAIDRLLGGAADLPANRELLRHIIGIERWGQRRLRVTLGERPIRDEYDDYQPDADLSWAQLRAAFQETRSALVALAHELERAGVAPTASADHNQFGELTVRGWLHYLGSHAYLESKRFKAS